MDNSAGYAEPYKDVIHEDTIRIAGAIKAPDYCFRIGGTRKFFLEAKKPSVSIKNEPSAAYQLRRYAWSAKLPLSILSDFEEFAVYDCRIKPVKTDPASTARVFYCSCNEYAEKFDWIASVFSRDAVLKGSFDKFAKTNKTKRGTADVDDDFLATIESWRSELARSLALRNCTLSTRELNFAVQRIIDRIVFLRICEDRGIEDYGRLLALTNANRIYPRLCELFVKADVRYNSGLFCFKKEKGRIEQPDELTHSLDVDDDVLRAMLKAVYYPDSPYAFSVISSDILGQVYEQFLGKVIRLTDGHRAKVEDKPEVKKAGGVYYTPTYIVAYIVKQTVGRLVEGKTPREAATIHVLDPACGSGSFLIGAYEFLLDWHLNWYTANEPEKCAKGSKPAVVQIKGGWKLTIAERKGILLNSIYGVDIDPQAVEVTKLSLLLKVLEGESEQSVQQVFEMFHERALPDLGSNIKCGNSLIGPDFYQQDNLPELTDDDRLRINVFDWKQAFPQIIGSRVQGSGSGTTRSGFDAVIGNPPYIRVRTFKDLFPTQAEHLERTYDCAKHVWDVYLVFYEKAVQLAKEAGSVSMIIPIQTLHQPNCESLRRYLLNNTHIRELADLSCLKVFAGAIVKNCILTCDRISGAQMQIGIRTPEKDVELVDGNLRFWSQSAVHGNPGMSMKVELLSPIRSICEKLIANSWLLKDLCYSTFGLRSCAKEKGQGGKERLISMDSKAKCAKPYLEGRDIKRYAMNPTGRFIRYVPEQMYSPRSPQLFETPKIVSQTMLSRSRIIATYDDRGYYVEQSLACIIPHGILTPQEPQAQLPLKYILGVINSRLEEFFFGSYVIDQALGGGLIHATPGAHDRLIIPKPRPDSVRGVVDLVDRMLTLQNQQRKTKTPHEKEALERQIAATDQQIDRLVCEMYGLTEDEIKIVERAS